MTEEQQRIRRANRAEAPAEILDNSKIVGSWVWVSLKALIVKPTAADFLRRIYGEKADFQAFTSKASYATVQRRHYYGICIIHATMLDNAVIVKATHYAKNTTRCFNAKEIFYNCFSYSPASNTFWRAE